MDIEEDVSFEALPPQKSARPAERVAKTQHEPAPVHAINGTHDAPRAIIEATFLSAIMNDPTGDSLRGVNGMPADVFSDIECRGIWLTLAGGTDPNDFLEVQRRSKMPMPRLLDILQLDRDGLRFRQSHAALIAEHQRLEMARLAGRMKEDPNLEMAWIQGELERIGALARHEGQIRLAGRSFADFRRPPDGDRSILLGNRYLCRGDGCILSSTSGMGKSSLTLQAAALWALGRDLFGVKPNGCLRSLIAQSEDSEGDIGEVWLSLCDALRLTAAEQAIVGERVKIVTDRVHQGTAFVTELRRHTADHQPDLVWINPLLAFLGGDINDAMDTGAFLRAGLNSLNEPPRFAYIAVHHTAKPPKEKTDRKWSEVMYDMAGSADITNWARAVISLRSADEEGDFDLVFAKRGTRAGATVPAGAADQFEDIVTKVPIRHSKAKMKVDGMAGDMPVIFWERRIVTATEKTGRGRPKEHTFAAYKEAFPVGPDKAVGVNTILRNASEWGSISKPSLYTLIEEALQAGLIVRTSIAGHPKYYRNPDPAT